MKIALAGLGGAAIQGHLPALRKLEREHCLRLVAAADSAQHSRAQAATSLRDIPLFDSVETMLTRVEANALVIATPPSSHAELITLGIAHRVHVLCEKPLVLSKGDRDTVEAAADGPHRLAIISIHQYRYSRAWLRLAPWLRLANALGAPYSMHATVHRQDGSDPYAASQWRKDLSTSGGMLADHGAHFTALAWTIDPALSVIDAKRDLDHLSGERSWAKIRIGSGILELHMSGSTVARYTSLDIRTRGLACEWRGEHASVRVAGHRIASFAPGSLSDRSYLDSLYYAFYRDVLHNLSNAAWRTTRTAESVGVAATLVEMLAHVAA